MDDDVRGQIAPPLRLVPEHTVHDDNERLWRMVDVVAIVVAVVMGAYLVGDWRPESDGFVDSAIRGVRAVSALSFVLFVPGWTMMRLVGIRPSSLSLVAAFIASVSSMIATSFLMATLDAWSWRPAGLVWVAVTVVGLLVAGRVRSAERRVPLVEAEAQ